MDGFASASASASSSSSNLIPANAVAPLEIDPNLDTDTTFDGDSAFGAFSDTASTKHTSLKSFVKDYIYENGRRYHAFREGSYYIPNDDREQERLEHYHVCWVMLRGGRLFNAPIGRYPQRVLDLGTGTGSWAVDFADQYPSAEVIGNDLSAIQPTWIPPNCKFIVDDIASAWTYGPDEAFDFIHMRMLNGAISDWSQLYQQVYLHLKPGAWFEQQEFAAWVYSDDDPDLKRAPTLKRLMYDVDRSSKTIGKDTDIAHTIKQGLLDAGFVDVREDLYKVPFGLWTKGKNRKILGSVLLDVVSESLDAYGFTLMTRVLGMSGNKARAIIAKAEEEFRDRSNHFYGIFRFVYGRKPGNGK